MPTTESARLTRAPSAATSVICRECPPARICKTRRWTCGERGSRRRGLRVRHADSDPDRGGTGRHLHPVEQEHRIPGDRRAHGIHRYAGAFRPAWSSSAGHSRSRRSSRLRPPTSRGPNGGWIRRRHGDGTYVAQRPGESRDQPDTPGQCNSSARPSAQPEAAAPAAGCLRRANGYVTGTDAEEAP
jgi:hypothetical protein